MRLPGIGRKRGRDAAAVLTRLGEKSFIWSALAVLLYLTGSRRARRAALRGLVSLGATAALINLPIKALRRRGRKRWRRTSEPRASRHATSAFAFATGAALELPPTALLLGPLAGSVAFARATDDERSLGDVVVGAALGAGFALASTRVWPVPPRLGPEAPKVWLPDRVEPSPEGKGLAIVVNKSSGSSAEPPPTEELRTALPEATIVEVDVDGHEDLSSALQELAPSAIALGVSGGDGSVNTAAQVALEHQKALVVFPSGTLNHLTHALGIETIDDAVAAVRSGEAVAIDVASIDDRMFLNTASFGSYVELVDARERLERRIGKWPAVVVALIRVLRSSEPVRVEIEGTEHEVWMAFIGNCRYHPSGFAPSWRRRFDDELLDFRFIDGGQPWARTRLVLAVLTGRLGRSKVYRQTLTKELTLRSIDGPIRLARDGETFEGSEEFVVKKLPKRLAVYVPHEKRE